MKAGPRGVDVLEDWLPELRHRLDCAVLEIHLHVNAADSGRAAVKKGWQGLEEERVPRHTAVGQGRILREYIGDDVEDIWTGDVGRSDVELRGDNLRARERLYGCGYKYTKG